MNNQDFIKEVSESEFAYPDFIKDYEEFQQYQALAMDTLKEVHRVCCEYDIHYVLTYGSLLGAIRDNGQIPWDYDIDIFVPYDDRKKLFHALSDGLDGSYYFVGAENTKRCCRGITRVSPKGYNSDELHVDIFYYTGASDDEEERKRDTNKLSMLQKTRFIKYSNLFSYSQGSIKKFCGLLINKIKKLTVSEKYILSEYDRICSKHPVEKAHYITSAGIGANRNMYLKDDVYERILYKTESGEFYIPKGYENFLKNKYGDFTKYPSLESRVKEFKHHLEWLRKYAK